MEIRSKYQNKNYEEVEYLFEECECPTCMKLFMIDLDKCKLVEKEDQARLFYSLSCPYCGRKWHICS